MTKGFRPLVLPYVERRNRARLGALLVNDIFPTPVLPARKYLAGVPLVEPSDDFARPGIEDTLDCFRFQSILPWHGFHSVFLIHGAPQSRALFIIEGRVSARLPLPSGERERMGVKRNRQGWCGPQAKPRTRPCLFRFRGKEAETPSPFKRIAVARLAAPLLSSGEDGGCLPPRPTALPRGYLGEDEIGPRQSMVS